MLARLAVLRDPGLELALARRDDEDRDVGLGRARDHVLDEVAVARGVDDRDDVLLRLELPERDVDRDPALALVLELVEDPRVLEGALAHLRRALLVLVDRALVDPAALVDQVARQRRLPVVDVPDDDEVDVLLLLAHSEVFFSLLQLFYSKVNSKYFKDYSERGIRSSDQLLTSRFLCRLAFCMVCPSPLCLGGQ